MTELEAVMSLQQLYLKHCKNDGLKMAHLIDFLQVCLQIYRMSGDSRNTVCLYEDLRPSMR